MASVIRGSDNFDSAAGAGLKAWVNFNGTGTVAIRAAYNVSSITDNGTGNYTVNFTTAMPDGNYSAVVSTDNNGQSCTSNLANSSLTTTNFKIFVLNSTPAFLDSVVLTAAVFR